MKYLLGNRSADSIAESPFVVLVIHPFQDNRKNAYLPVRYRIDQSPPPWQVILPEVVYAVFVNIGSRNQSLRELYPTESVVL